MWGHEVAVGYFAQDHTDSIAKGTTVIEWLHEFDPQASQEELRGLLGQMLFSGDDALKPTKALSGGEAARLIFCRLMLQKPNFLVLDEPTNHLDLESINALNIALQKYDGTVLLVTPRSRPDRRSGHAHLALRGRPDRRLQGPVRRVPRARRAGKGRPGKSRAIWFAPARPSALVFSSLPLHMLSSRARIALWAMLLLHIVIPSPNRTLCDSVSRDLHLQFPSPLFCAVILSAADEPDKGRSSE